MIKIGTEVKIIDNFHEHIGYVKDSILKIIEHDEDGYYILSSGHYCSESEIEEQEYEQKELLKEKEYYTKLVLTSGTID